MDTGDLKNKPVAVLGYGLEGKATAKYLIKHGIKPVLFDQKPWDKWANDEQEEIKKLGVNFIFGPDCFKELAGFNVAFRSPGIKLSQVTGDKLRVTSQTKWFFEHCPTKIIGITGTKGKGTTSALTYEMLKTDGKNSYLTGNIGKIQPLDILDDLKPNDWVVYELSSFQLQDLTQSPHIAVVLMTTSEHLDYHKDQAEYLDAKSSITKFQTANDVAIINADFENSVKIGELGSGKKLYLNREAKFLSVNGAENVISDLALSTSNAKLRGAHNLENIIAAALAAKSAGCTNEAIQLAVNNFPGLENRLELVTEKNGIKFYNDSFSTTPETAIAAINSFTEPLVIILGGASKNSDFTELGKVIAAAKNIKTLIIIGAEGKKIQTAISEAGGATADILTGAKNMAEIFVQVKSTAKNGDVVLLSPACASFDMFKNYQDRGEQFKAAALNY